MTNADSRPTAPNAKERSRWELTKLRRRLLEGLWRSDIENHMALHLDATRKASWGPATGAFNLFKSVVQQLSVLYDTEPIVSNDELTPLQSDYIDSLNLFSKSQKHNELVVGLRESFIKLAWNGGNHVSKPGVITTLVTPDNIVSYAQPNAPTVPVRIDHVVQRLNPISKNAEYFWDVYDISDASNPSFKILTTTEPRKDVTALFLPEDQVDYPYVDVVSGVPFLPWVLYHAENVGKLFDASKWHELVWGSLDLALLYSFYIHIVKDASWAQKYGIDVELNGLSTVDSGKATRQKIATDPASILLFSSKDNAAGSLNTFTTATDAKSVIDSIKSFSNAIIANIGISPVDMQKTAAPQSGVAIKLKRESIRRYQTSFAANFRLGDIELLEKTAMITNLFSDASVPALPTKGYEISYTSLPKDSAELNLDLDLALKLFEAGLKSKADILLDLEPSLGTKEKALQRLRDIKVENS